ncbi:MAG TPA: carboxypeptidase-like regulatory domain-containing protein [Tepidisphaeraceae bacterium]|jgi:hypothetical protein|nr:carboxypeptidase-like regulatory domain-containing protein [Tepidisphaeraceae bacterium]
MTVIRFWFLFSIFVIISQTTAATLTGSVEIEGGDKANGLYITLWNKTPNSRYSPLSAVTDSEGRFSVEHLEPGKYDVSVVLHDRKLDENGVYENYVNPMIEVDVTEDKSAHVVIPLKLGAAVRVRPVDKDGKPFKQCGGQIVFTDRRGTTAPDGSFIMHGISPDKSCELHLDPVFVPTYSYILRVPIAGKDLVAGKTFDLGDIKFESEPAEENLILHLFEVDGSRVPDMALIRLFATDRPVMDGGLVQKGELKIRILPGHYNVVNGPPGHEWVMDAINIPEGKVLETTMTLKPNPH